MGRKVILRTVVAAVGLAAATAVGAFLRGPRVLSGSQAEAVRGGSCSMGCEQRTDFYFRDSAEYPFRKYDHATAFVLNSRTHEAGIPHRTPLGCDYDTFSTGKTPCGTGPPGPPSEAYDVTGTWDLSGPFPDFVYDCRS
jgi:hypothetical protein